MRHIFRLVPLAAACLFTLALSAQASRTWISGVGDDANPGSRTAPCKTIAGAISKTAAGGEIDALDPGGFGAVTITKAITIDGGSGQVASVLVAGTNGINISAGPNDVVILRNLRIQGIGSGLVGINFLSGKALIIDNCTIMNFLNRGVYVNPSASMVLSISNTSIVGTPAASTLIGVMIDHASAPLVSCDMENVNIVGATNAGIYSQNGKLSLNGCSITGGGSGVVLSSGADAQLEGVSLVNNAIGLKLGGGSMRLSNCTISGNGTGVIILGGAITSFGNNRIAGNSNGNGPLSGTLLLQ